MLFTHYFEGSLLPGGGSPSDSSTKRCFLPLIPQGFPETRISKAASVTQQSGSKTLYMGVVRKGGWCNEVVSLSSKVIATLPPPRPWRIAGSHGKLRTVVSHFPCHAFSRYREQHTGWGARKDQTWTRTIVWCWVVPGVNLYWQRHSFSSYIKQFAARCWPFPWHNTR